MHVALQTFDIVDTILALLQEDYNVGRRTLKALSMTCLSLSEIALDRLWHTQPNFVALIKTMPPDYWFESSLAGARNIGSFDFRVKNLHVKLFDRLNFYAHRIRKVSYVPHAMHTSEDIPLDITALHSLWSLRPDASQPMLPNLKQVEFPDASHIMLDMFLACPSIVIDIGMGSTNLSVAYSLQNFASNIYGLHLGSPGSTTTSPPSSVLLDAMCDMPNLRTLTTSFKLNTTVLARLACLPSLYKLGIPNCSKDILSSIISSSKAKFIALQELELVEKSFAAFTELLKEVGTIYLRSLTIHSSAPLAENELDAALSALQNACGIEFLHTLRLQVPTSPATFNSTTLRPLLASPRLTTLQLDIDCQYYLTDADFKDIAAAWPNMQFLQIGPLKGWSRHSPDPMTTFHSLLYLLEGCRNLERLVFCLNGLIPPPVASEITTRHINHNITILWLGDSPIDKFCATTVRKFLKTVLPNLVSINGQWSVTNARGKISTPQRLWMKVAKSEAELKLIYMTAGGSLNEFL